MEVAADKAINITTNCKEETLQTLEEIAVEALGHHWGFGGTMEALEATVEALRATL